MNQPRGPRRKASDKHNIRHQYGFVTFALIIASALLVGGLGAIGGIS